MTNEGLFHKSHVDTINRGLAERWILAPAHLSQYSLKLLIHMKRSGIGEKEKEDGEEVRYRREEEMRVQWGTKEACYPLVLTQIIVMRNFI